MQRVARSYREFKCNLTCLYIHKNRPQKREEQLDTPFEMYTQLSDADYKEFVSQRMDPEFQVSISVKNIVNNFVLF